jgi:hypothetical protein
VLRRTTAASFGMRRLPDAAIFYSQFAAMRSRMKWLEFNITYTTTDRVCHMRNVNVHSMYVTELKDMFTLALPLICYVSVHTLSCSVQSVSWSVYAVFIAPTGTLRLPRLRFFRAFSSVVRQMPGYNSQRRGTARTLVNCVVLRIFCVICVVLCIVCV